MARSSGAPDLCTKEQTKKALEELSPQDLRVLQNVLLADDMGEENFAVITEWLSDTADWSTEKILEKICPGHRKSVLKKSQHLKRMAQKVLDMEVYALANTMLRDEIFRLLAKQIKDRSDAANKATAREHAEKEAAKQKADADHHQAVQAKKEAQDAHAKHLGDVEKIANDAADRDAKAKKTQDAYLTAQKKHDEDQKKLDALRKKASKAQENHLKHAGQHVSAEKEKEEKQKAKKQAEEIADAKLKVAESANAEHAKATKALIDQDAADKANKKLVDKLDKVHHGAHVMAEAATHFSGVHDNQDAIKPHGHRRLEQDRRLLAGAK